MPDEHPITDSTPVPPTPITAFLDAAAQVLEHSVHAHERAIAAGVLGALADEAYITLLLHALETESSRQVQLKVSQAIARIGGEAAIEGLQAMMYAGNPYTRFLAAETLADIVSRGRA